MTPEAQQLIDDLRALDGPSREMDARLSVYSGFYLDGQVQGSAIVFSDGEVCYSNKYTASIDAALTLIPDGWTIWSVINEVDIKTYSAYLVKMEFSGPKTAGHHNKSIPIAILIAAIKASEADKDKTP